MGAFAQDEVQFGNFVFERDARSRLLTTVEGALKLGLSMSALCGVLIKKNSPFYRRVPPHVTTAVHGDWLVLVMSKPQALYQCSPMFAPLCTSVETAPKQSHLRVMALYVREHEGPCAWVGDVAGGVLCKGGQA